MRDRSSPGSAIRALSMEGRMTVCNMSIEAGARAGMVAGRRYDDRISARPAVRAERAGLGARGRLLEALRSDPDARFDREVALRAEEIRPHVTWGTSPEMVVSIEGEVPDPDREKDSTRREGIERALSYMGLKPRTRITDIRLDKCFIGSCTNSRIEDLRAAAAVVKGRRVAQNIRLAMVVPGSGLVKAQAEREGLDRVFRDAGFEWREPGCSMCLAMNADRLEPGERCASTSNRNFEGRQGDGGRTHLVSPRWRPPRRSRDISSTCAPGARHMEKFTVLKGLVRTARSRQRRHRPDHREAVPEVDQAHRLRAEPVRCLALHRPGRRPGARPRSACRIRISSSISRATRARRSCLRARISAAAARASTRPGR
jgi:hypothetical protein